jgi:ketosteroid isomerase-like protein
MRKVLIAIVIFFFLPFTICAQDKKVKQVASAVEKLTNALLSGSHAALGDLTMEQLSYGHSSGVIENKTEFIQKLASGQSDFVTIDITQQTISVSGKTALVRHRLDAKINDNGKAGEVHLLVLLVWQKEGGKWKLLARQAVKAI